MEDGFAIWANPSSPHAEGRKAKAALEDARERCKRSLGWDGELIFTSGASEAAALALNHAKAGARLVSAIEHDCILGIAKTAERMPIRETGALDLDALAEAVQRERPLVAVQQVNSETGHAQHMDDIAQIIVDAGGLLLADCSQSAGKLALPDCDMAIISAHKFGGPIGIGALLVRDYGLLDPVGGHERGYRRGTENMPGALGMAAALQASLSEPLCAPDCRAAMDRLAETVRQAGGVWMSDRFDYPTDYIHAVAAPSMSATAQVMRLDMAGFAVSQGSACSSGTMKTSHVLGAMNVDRAIADRVIRMSIGWTTTPDEIDAFTEAWKTLV
ncbi:aminotransferase [Aurantiacibacter gangjinensis]|uniref:Cysteine desulfurase n=2 Tax=Aurantiacibacter gangjinensis TaxID=502682 RepID=A0A0G9MSL7_9SPHN|nr:aminotransferase [Aurantiacibacter gangjinensis]